MKKIIILSLSAALLYTANAQDTRSEFSIQTAGGISTFQYKPNIGNKTTGAGGNFGLGYTYFFSEKWGLGTGVECTLFNTKFNVAGQKYVTPGLDPSSNTSFLLNCSLTDFNEKQQAWLINIPLMLHFQTGKFYFGAGAKIGFPLSASYTTDKGVLETTGFFEDINWSVPSSGYEHLGFGQYDLSGSDGDISLKTVVMASAEIGAKWRMSDKWSLYTGLYVDYGLNNTIRAGSKTNLTDIAHNGAGVHIPSSIIQSRYIDRPNGKPTDIVDKVLPLSAGLKLRFAFRVKTSQPAPVAIQPINQKELDALREQVSRQSEAIRRAEQEADKRWKEVQDILQKQDNRESSGASQRPQAIPNIDTPLIGYNFGQTALSADKKAQLDKKVILLKQYPDLHITCIGHTCDRGNEESNNRTGLHRAEAAKAYLVSQGISSGRITVQSQGSRQPLQPNTGEENRRQNRRVEFKSK
jgi:outer membrane protein OmpA-like peptidoglycan-associated protein